MYNRTLYTSHTSLCQHSTHPKNMWFQWWPEHPLALPDISAEAMLTKDHTKILATALTQWACTNRAVNNKTLKVIYNLLKPKTCTKKLWKIYSKVYFKLHIQSYIENGMAIADVTKKIRELYENESPKIKENVHRMSMEHKKGEKIEGKEDLLMHHRNIKECGPAFQHVLKHLSIQTGWHFSVLMGSPDPLDPTGNNMITSLHIGKTSDNHDFSDVYAEFDMVVIASYVLLTICVRKHIIINCLATQYEQVSMGGTVQGGRTVNRKKYVRDGQDWNVDNRDDIKGDDIVPTSTVLAAPSHLAILSTTMYLAIPPTTTHLATPATATHLATSLTTTYLATPLTTTHLATPLTTTHLATPLTVHTVSTPIHLASEAVVYPAMPTTATTTNLATLATAVPTGLQFAVFSNYRDSTMLDAMISPNPTYFAQFEPFGGFAPDFFTSLLNDETSLFTVNNFNGSQLGELKNINQDHIPGGAPDGQALLDLSPLLMINDQSGNWSSQHAQWTMPLVVLSGKENHISLPAIEGTSKNVKGKQMKKNERSLPDGKSPIKRTVKNSKQSVDAHTEDRNTTHKSK
ncbi:hypothetical protein HD554DRAFT_2039167 [Boletus coccyginus]|nr:hypothetical protein HD554DRAFT_2039167 [Boletus coccyginus]